MHLHMAPSPRKIAKLGKQLPLFRQPRSRSRVVVMEVAILAELLSMKWGPGEDANK